MLEQQHQMLLKAFQSLNDRAEKEPTPNPASTHASPFRNPPRLGVDPHATGPINPANSTLNSNPLSSRYVPEMPNPASTSNPTSSVNRAAQFEFSRNIFSNVPNLNLASGIYQAPPGYRGQQAQLSSSTHSERPKPLSIKIPLFFDDGDHFVTFRNKFVTAAQFNGWTDLYARLALVSAM